MEPITTARLKLRPATVHLAERIAGRYAEADDTWGPDFPCTEDVMAATMFLLLTQLDGEQHPFGLYTIERRRDLSTIGSISFKARPQEGRVEIGYSIAPSARGAGFAGEAVRALVDLARTRGVERVIATVLETNHASRRTLENAGLHQTAHIDGECTYETLLPPRAAGGAPA